MIAVARRPDGNELFAYERTTERRWTLLKERDHVFGQPFLLADGRSAVSVTPNLGSLSGPLLARELRTGTGSDTIFPDGPVAWAAVGQDSLLVGTLAPGFLGLTRGSA